MNYTEEQLRRIRLIACDMDGTLFQGTANAPSTRSLEQIKELSRLGVRFLAASGRQYANLTDIFSPVRDLALFMSDNGALVYDGDRRLFLREGDRELFMELIDAYIDLDDCEIMLSAPDCVYLKSGADDFYRLVHDGIGYVTRTTDDLHSVPGPLVKLTLFSPVETYSHVMERTRADVGDRAVVVSSGQRWMDINPHTTNKGDALKEIAAIYGYKPEEIAAFGDNENDREMLEFAGLPYLMLNCNPVMKDMRGKCADCSLVEDELDRIIRALKN